MNTHRRPFRFVRALVALPLLALIAASATHAASVCVSSSAQLQARLAESTSQPDNAPYTIKLMQGTYNFGWGRVAPSSQFTLAGGYTDANCSNRSIDPDNTVIDFGGNGYLEIFQATASPIASVTVEGVTFRNGEGVSLEAGKYNHISDDAGNVNVRNSRFTALTSNPTGQYAPEFNPVHLASRKGSLSVVNTIFDHLHQAVVDNACEATIELMDDASAVLMFVSVDTSAGQSFCIYPDYDGGSNTVQVFNSIFWPNDGIYGEFQPLHFADSGADETPPNVSLYYNTIWGYDGGATVQDFFTRSANPQDKPQWINPAAGAGANYGLLPTSTSINSGFPSGIVFYPTIDIASSPRVVGIVDRGAVESPYVDTPSTIVTNANDSGPGSLRSAIITANQFDNPDTITFSLPTCPSIIKLQSALPIIRAPLTIDGYANNPLAAPNSDPNAFNATLCVAIEEAVPNSIVSAITVDTYSGGLTLRGIAFGGFLQQVSILGGSDHYLSGNQFGGSVAGVNLSGANNNAIFVHGVVNGTVTIGGPSPGDRNDIVNATRDGILMDNSVTTTNCHIDNNLIGLMPNGVSENGNEYGIELQNNHCEISKNRIAANMIDGIWINGGRFNLVQSNVFGLNAYGNGTQSYGWAVRVDGNNNVIGAPQNVGYLPELGNAISFMGLGGILVNGINDSVRANLSGFNGNAHDGSAPDIKLAAGANFQQPSAVIDSLALPNGMPAGTDKPAAVVGHLDSGANGAYRIDVYYSTTCAPGSHGHAEYYLATQQVTTNASGHATFSIPLTLPDSPVTSVLSLSATDNYANSSELGTCFAVANGTSDVLFKNGFDP